MLPVTVVRLDPDLPLPSYAHPGDAGLDLHAREGAVVKAGGGRAIVPTGIALIGLGVSLWREQRTTATVAAPVAAPVADPSSTTHEPAVR